MKTQLANAYMRNFNGSYTVFVKGLDEAIHTVITTRYSEVAEAKLKDLVAMVEEYNSHIILAHGMYSDIMRYGEGGIRL